MKTHAAATALLVATTASVGGRAGRQPFPVRWIPDASYGYGYPFYNFYAPFKSTSAAGFFAVRIQLRAGHPLAQVTGFFVAGLGMFYLGRNWWASRWAGLLAAVAYTAAPFHMVNVYVRGDSLAEFWAMAFYPLVLLAADGLLAGGGAAGKPERESGRPARDSLSPGRWPCSLWPTPAPILSHNISALIFSPFLLLYIVAFWQWGRQMTNHRPPEAPARGLREQQSPAPCPLSLGPPRPYGPPSGV